MKLGHHQLSLLMAMGSPSMILVTPDRIARSLQKHGLIAPWRDAGALRITPAGMRALADAYEAGALEQFMRPLAPPKAA